MVVKAALVALTKPCGFGGENWRCSREAQALEGAGAVSIDRTSLLWTHGLWNEKGFICINEGFPFFHWPGRFRFTCGNTITKVSIRLLGIYYVNVVSYDNNFSFISYYCISSRLRLFKTVSENKINSLVHK